MSKLSELGQPFCDVYRRSLPEPTQIPATGSEDVAKIAWLVTSTFHDVAYPLEAIRRWLPKMLVDFLGDAGGRITPDVPLERIFFESQTYLDFVNELAKFFADMGLVSEVKESDIRAWMQQVVGEKKDHGVLSSLILLALHPLRRQEVVLPACLAIALHKRVGQKMQSCGAKVTYGEYPLLFLLLYCDLVQEWYRDPQEGKRKSPILERIEVVKDIDALGNAARYVPEDVKASPETVYVYCKIDVPKETQRKIDECKAWLGFVRSKNPYFAVEVNEQFFGSWPTPHKPRQCRGKP